MGMTQAILEARRKVLGASETPVILGFGKYAGQTPDAIYWSKVGPQIEKDTDATQMGNDFEPALVQWAQRQLGVTFDTDPGVCFQIALDGIGKGILAATPDGILLNGTKRWGLEGKAVMYGNPGIDSWGEQGTDKIPDDVLIQTQQQAAVWNLDVVFVPVLWCVGFRPEFRMYRVERDADLFDGMIAPKAVNWWNEHIVTQIPPGDEPPAMEVIKAMERKKGVYIPASETIANLIQTWDDVRLAKNLSDKDAEHYLRQILTELGDAEGFTLPDGRIFKYAQQNGQRRTDYDVLQEKYPDAYKETVKQGTHRTPRIVGKAKGVTA